MNDAVEAAVRIARERQASDLHIDPQQGVALRIHAAIQRVETLRIAPEETDAFVDRSFDRVARARFERIGFADACYQSEQTGPLRVHASRGRNGARLALRLLNRFIPPFESLGLPDSVALISEAISGLIIVAGPAGAGKTTTAVSLLDRLNRLYERHIVTFEDPIEHSIAWMRSVVTQYQIGRDVSTFADGVRGALRCDPNVIFIGELRDREGAAAALQAAETGHLVLLSLHSPTDAAAATNRITGMFEPEVQEHARYRVADVLRAVIALKLVPQRNGTGSVPAAEILIVNDSMRRLLRDGNLHRMHAAIGAGRPSGMQTLEDHLVDLISAGEIDTPTALASANEPNEILERLGTRGR
ncbi:MAG: Flp pilus assembly complex ATPase component TadA [Candidatus Eremiobacteraeota bacterium]|nr:Flp pilus assembly complex ATPase component TadA [Candidatus Eremiobacteraeota bacterium]